MVLKGGVLLVLLVFLLAVMVELVRMVRDGGMEGGGEGGWWAAVVEGWKGSKVSELQGGGEGE